MKPTIEGYGLNAKATFVIKTKMHWKSSRMTKEQEVKAYLKRAPFNQMSSAAIGRDLNLSISHLARILKELLDNGVVEKNQHGRLSIYSLKKSKL